MKKLWSLVAAIVILTALCVGAEKLRGMYGVDTYDLAPEELTQVYVDYTE